MSEGLSNLGDWRLYLLSNCCFSTLLHSHGYAHITAHRVGRDIIALLRVSGLLLLALPNGFGHVGCSVQVYVLSIKLALVKFDL
mmetsp:Transcript_26683/g.40704  ORF Transcript_26683/g.40704 Transcript_26683/m.40704 type:complete len:84 (-) Transcript_26683:710-961(-)